MWAYFCTDRSVQKSGGSVESSTPRAAAVSTAGFGLKGPRGWVFRDVGIAAEPGALIAVEGPSGSARTCLLLALTGRMRANTGHAEVAGLRLPGGRPAGSAWTAGREGLARTGRMAAVRRISALGPVPGVAELEPSLTVAEHLREHALLHRRYDGSPRALLRPRGERAADTRRRVDAALEAAGFDPGASAKGLRTAVRDLDRLESLRFSVTLALIGRPRLLAVDDTDLKLSAADRAAAWDLLRSVAAAGTTVLAVCSEAPNGAVTVTTTPAAAGEAGAVEADEPAGSAGSTEATEHTEHTDDEEGAADALAETGRA